MIGYFKVLSQSIWEGAEGVLATLQHIDRRA